MKRLGTIERAGLVLSAVFIVFGAYSIVHPTEGYVLHPGSPRYSLPDPVPEHVTKSGARIQGFISVGLGTGLAWLAFYRPSK
jgi:hypothetical protein